MVKAKKTAKASKKAPKKAAVKKVRLSRSDVVHVITPKNHVPVIVHKAPGIVEVVPVHHEKAKAKGFWKTFLGIPD